MSFQKLRVASVNRKLLLPFIKVLLDHDILIAIGAADELQEPLGYKQLVLLELAPATTLRRRLNVLLGSRIIRRSTQRDDGRRVSYSLTRKTLVAYQLYMLKVLP
jgi:hypothetical protein